MKFKFILAFVSCLLFVLTGCGGGGGGGSTATSTETAAGLWIGTITDDTNVTYDVVGIISTTGELRISSLNLGAEYAGQISVSGNQGSGSFKGYAPEGYYFSNGLPTTTGTLNFNLVEKSSISGTYTSPGDNGTFFLTYSPDLEGSTPVSSIAGRWGYDNPGDWVHLVVDSAGGISGTDDLGCLYSGNISVPSEEWSIFSLSLDVSECGQFNGTYNGLTVLDDANSMLYMFSNGTYAVLDELFFNGW